jgi:hypothetical protein
MAERMGLLGPPVSLRRHLQQPVSAASPFLIPTHARAAGSLCPCLCLCFSFLQRSEIADVVSLESEGEGERRTSEREQEGDC